MQLSTLLSMRRPSKENKALENNIPKEDVPRTQKLVASMLLEDRHVLQTDQIQLGNLVGSGGFAKVFACQLDGQPAVCKMIPAEKINDEVYIFIRDSGPGVSEAFLSEIFNPFTREEKSRAKISGGLGLGLLLVYQIVRAHSGRIKASNHEKGGFCIEIWLPSLELDKSS